MLVINFKGNTPQQRFYSFGVKNNNKSNIISFVVDAQQEDINLLNCACNLKVRNKENNFLDLNLLNGEYDENNGTITFDWLMTAKSTKYRNLELQLEFIKTENEDVVWQTLIVEIEFNNSFIVGESQPDEHELSILKQVEKEVVKVSQDVSALENSVGVLEEKTTENTQNISEINSKLKGYLPIFKKTAKGKDIYEYYLEHHEELATDSYISFAVLEDDNISMSFVSFAFYDDEEDLFVNGYGNNAFGRIAIEDMNYQIFKDLTITSLIENATYDDYALIGDVPKEWYGSQQDYDNIEEKDASTTYYIYEE